jgi:hypothetical protein
MIIQTAEFIAYGLAALGVIGIVYVTLVYLAGIVRGLF